MKARREAKSVSDTENNMALRHCNVPFYDYECLRARISSSRFSVWANHLSECLGQKQKSFLRSTTTALNDAVIDCTDRPGR